MATTEKSSGSGSGFSKEEKAAMREAAAERRRKQSDEEAAAEVLSKIAEMPDADRKLAERIHAIVTQAAPDLKPKTWYGMPSWANVDGKVVVFFQDAAKFKARYATLGFQDSASLDDGNLWPTSYALTKLTKADEKEIARLVKKAVG